MTPGTVEVGDKPGTDTAVPKLDGKSLPWEQSEVVALWIHYEERATEIKGQMYSTLTFLNTALLPLAGLLASWLMESHFGDGPSNVTPSLVLIASTVGLLLSVLSILLAEDYISHTQRAFLRSGEIRKLCPKLDQALRLVEPSPPKRWCKRRDVPAGKSGPSPPERFFQWWQRLSGIAFAIFFLAAIGFL
jgi:hypothetical protein